MIYILVYISLLWLALLSYGRLSARSLFYSITFVFLFVFVGFRYEVGCDWSGYQDIFEAQRFATLGDALQRKEPLFWVANYMLHEFDLDYPYINIVASVVFFMGLRAIAKRQPDRLAILILAFPVLIINLAMSGIRQGMAIAFICFAYNAFVDRRLALFVFFVTLGTTFHFSALFFMPLAPFVRGEFTRQRILLSATAALPVVTNYVLTSDSVVDYTTRYSGVGAEQAAGAPFRTGLLAITGLIFLLFLRQKWKSQSNSDYRLILLSSYFMIVVFPITFFSSVMADRFGYYLMPVQLIILARLPLIVDSLVAVAAPYAVGLLFLCVWTQYSQHFAECYLPYRTWLDI